MVVGDTLYVTGTYTLGPGGVPPAVWAYRPAA